MLEKLFPLISKWDDDELCKSHKILLPNREYQSLTAKSSTQCSLRHFVGKEAFHFSINQILLTEENNFRGLLFAKNWQIERKTIFQSLEECYKQGKFPPNNILSVSTDTYWEQSYT